MADPFDSTMKYHTHLPGLLLLACTAAPAMSLRDAGENVPYFEHARLATEHCEGRGFRVRPAYEAWASGNSKVHADAADAIRRQAERGGLSRSEQEAVLKEAVDAQRELARENIAKKGV